MARWVDQSNAIYCSHGQKKEGMHACILFRRQIAVYVPRPASGLLFGLVGLRQLCCWSSCCPCRLGGWLPLSHIIWLLAMVITNSMSSIEANMTCSRNKHGTCVHPIQSDSILHSISPLMYACVCWGRSTCRLPNNLSKSSSQRQWRRGRSRTEI